TTETIQSAPTIETNVPQGQAPGTTNAPVLAGLLNKETLQTVAGGVAGFMRKAGIWLFGRVATWIGVFTGLALIPVYTFYFLYEKERISSRWTDYLPVSDSQFKDELVFVIRSI